MEFEIGRTRSGGAQRLRQHLGIATTAVDGFGQGFAFRVARSQHDGLEYAGEGPAANTGNSVIARLFRQKVDQFKRVGKLYVLFVQCLGDFQPGKNAKNAVKATTTNDGIAMRTDDQRFGPDLCSFATSDEIQGRILCNRQTDPRKLFLEPGPCLKKKRCEGSTCPRHIRQREAADCLNARTESINVDGRSIHDKLRSGQSRGKHCKT